MNTNDEFNSKKIMDDIDSLENDPQGKKSKVKYKMTDLLETLIVVSLVTVVIITIVSSCYKALIAGDRENYNLDNNYEDYFYDSNDTTIEDSNLNDGNKLASDVTLEEFLNSDAGNKIINEPILENSESIVIDESSDEENLETENEITEEDLDAILNKKIEVQRKNLMIKEEGISINDELIFSVENKNTEAVSDLYVYTVFYKENQIVGINEEEIDLIIQGNKKYLKVEEMPAEYDRYEVFITKYNDIFYNDLILNKDVECESYVENELVEIKIKNNSNKKINRADITIIYYDENKNILDIDDVSTFNIRRTGTEKATSYGIWSEKENEYLKFDSYELILDSAVHYE